MRAAVAVCTVVMALCGSARADEAIWAGVQLGGPNALQLVGRGRVLGPASLEAGFFGAPPFLMGSVGVVVEGKPTESIWVYAGAAVAAVFAFDEASCAAAEADCSDREDWLFYSGRVGVSTPVGPGRLSLDVGFWRGVARSHGGGELRRADDFTIPMAGVAWLVPIPSS